MELKLREGPVGKEGSAAIPTIVLRDSYAGMSTQMNGNRDRRWRNFEDRMLSKEACLNT